MYFIYTEILKGQYQTKGYDFIKPSKEGPILPQGNGNGQLSTTTLLSLESMNIWKKHYWVRVPWAQSREKVRKINGQ